jgi:ATP-binding cassette, subfamily B, bacterial
MMGGKSEGLGAGLRRYGRLLRYAGAGWKGWAVIVALTLASSLVGLLQPWPLQVVIDHVLGREPLGEALAWCADLLPGADSPRGLLAWAALAGLAVFALRGALDVVLTRLWIRVGQGMVYRLAGDLFARAQRRSLLFHSRTPVGDLMSRITGDSWSAYKLVDSVLFTPGYALVMMAGTVAVMASMDLTLTLVALAVAPFMAGASLLMGRPQRLAARARREVEARIQSHVQQTLSGIQVVQAFAREEREDARLRELTAAALRAQRRGALLAALGKLASGLAAAVGTGAVLWVGARHVLDGRLTVGGVLVFLAYLTMLQGQMQAFTGLYPTLQEVGAGVDRVLELLAVEPEVADRPGAPPLPLPLPPRVGEGLGWGWRARGHVRLEGVTFGYEPDRPVLSELWLELRPGETVAVVGPSGAGKSTLAALLVRLFDPWAGRVLLDGHDLRDVQLRSVREQVALALQEPLLFPLTVAENIEYARPGATRAEVEAAARAAGLGELVGRLPHGYDTLLGQRGATLSGGERQRLALARALLRGSAVLVLDEPTSALDAETEVRVLAGLLKSRESRVESPEPGAGSGSGLSTLGSRPSRGCTTLLIAHRLSTARAADRIVVLNHGRVAEEGSHAELLARRGLYARLYRLQAGEAPEAAGVAG